uniref:Essential protein Yae1 N-terminal domain-containing protein n=1 Tax=Oryza punctata TaxID=4537 RepID=A0A0E0LY49_ORYPU
MLSASLKSPPDLVRFGDGLATGRDGDGLYGAARVGRTAVNRDSASHGGAPFSIPIPSRRFPNQKPKDDFDFLEPSVVLDETHYQTGFKNGYSEGLVSRKEEGRHVGLKNGFRVGEELGFYKGCLDVWTPVVSIDQDAFSARVRKYIEQLAALLRSYPLSNPEDEQVQDIMEKIRLKFRVITTSLGAKLQYQNRPTSFNEDVEDL